MGVHFLRLKLTPMGPPLPWDPPLPANPALYPPYRRRKAPEWSRPLFCERAMLRHVRSPYLVSRAAGVKTSVGGGAFCARGSRAAGSTALPLVTRVGRGRGFAQTHGEARLD